MESDTVLVTGGAGFIGHHLTSTLLSQGRKVKVLDDFSSGTELPTHPLLTVIEGTCLNLWSERKHFMR